jgi:hypothetical protein
MPEKKRNPFGWRKKLALRNALRYFEAQHHEELIQEFRQELETYGRIYMYRFRPDYEMRARPIEESWEMRTGAIMLMIQNNLDYAVTSSRTHIWWKRSCFSKLGTILINNEIPVRNDRRADIDHVFRPSNGIVSIS